MNDEANRGFTPSTARVVAHKMRREERAGEKHSGERRQASNHGRRCYNPYA